MAGDKIELTKEEIEKIGDDKVFRTMTIEKLKQIVAHQEEQNGNISTTMKLVNKAFTKISSNTTSVKIYWGLFAILFSAIFVLFKIR